MKRFFNLSRTNDRRKGDQEIKLQHRAGSVEEPGGGIGGRGFGEIDPTGSGKQLSAVGAGRQQGRYVFKRRPRRRGQASCPSDCKGLSTCEV